MNFIVKTTPEADEDLQRLFDHLIDRAETLEDLRHADRANVALREAVASLAAAAPRCRKVSTSLGLRELVIPFGATGYLVLFCIEADTVYILGVRHQRESDYH